ncbi:MULTISPECIES: acetyl-CoA carboxylase biotin carboxyl carrier protein [unclassified Clostridium]|uniref:acetyl-CoA carboxylase biotin carboxyl carrier protein n=1 Tax=unclassified Clostridium TaxID=2614128 RepID=UPI0029135822|nr:acetyl-CoA carboxylase biotin carboxyl carrier protein [Clostridium sp.]MDU5107251.1 acetyl-CoA carboxylase biotin carboxyl carrier protein [Clostridium sp.]
MLTYEQIKDLIKSIDCSSLRVFELEDQDFKLKLSKNEESLKSNIEDNNLVNESEAKVGSSKVKRNLVNNMEETNSNDANINSNEVLYNIVKSPLVGTYYSCGTPGGKAYVKKGDYIKKGDVLCIVEAMKIMNEITSEFDGEIVEVLRSDEDIVEYGMELFKIK